MPLPEPFSEKYEILETLEQGGMGAVYRVRHRLVDELRVVKVLRFPLEPTPELTERFLGEAWKASRLHHPHLAVLHDYAVTEDGRAVLVLEDVEGLSLREILRRFGTPPLAVTLEIGRQVCRALDALHQQQILHSDLSPGGLLLSRDSGRRPLVKLIDLGLARSLEGGGEGLSTGGVFLGKLRYASPEQFGGDPIDERSDLYSLGIVLYELLTGRSPFEGHDPRSWMAAHLFGTPLDFAVSDPEGLVPEDLRALVLRALARNPEERIAGAEDFGQALEAIQAREPLVGDELAPIFGHPEPGPLPLAPSPVPAPSHPPGTGEGEGPQTVAVEESPLDWAAAPLSRSGWAGGGRAGEGMGEGAVLAPLETPEARAAGGPFLWESTADPPAEEPVGVAPVVPILPAPRKRAPLLPAALPIAVMLVLALFVFLKGRAWWNPQVKDGPPVPPIVAAPEAPAPQPVPPPAADPSPSPTPVTEEAAVGGNETPAASQDPETAADQIAEEPGEVETPPEPAPVPRTAVPAPRKAAPKAKPVRTAETAKPPKTLKIAERRPEPPPVPQRPTRIAKVLSPMRRGDLIQPGPGVSAPVPLEMPRFSYPPSARGQAGDMDVRLDLLVDENGKVIDAVVREGDPASLGFGETALAAARKVRFQPATRDDVPGKMWTDMIFEFSAGR
jgi:eukaryotic-like serine/threonine-protein kinase